MPTQNKSDSTQARRLVLVRPSEREVHHEDRRVPGGRTAKPRRSILDWNQPRGFVVYPYYTTREVAEILSISDDYVRSLFRNGRQGQVLQICDPKPGRRRYEVLLIPYASLIAFIERFTKDGRLELESVELDRHRRCA